MQLILFIFIFNEITKLGLTHVSALLRIVISNGQKLKVATTNEVLLWLLHLEHL